jgi:hypothetical protein
MKPRLERIGMSEKERKRKIEIMRKAEGMRKKVRE